MPVVRRFFFQCPEGMKFVRLHFRDVSMGFSHPEATNEMKKTKVNTTVFFHNSMLLSDITGKYFVNLMFRINMKSNEVNIRNKRASFEYHLEETFIAGVQLSGTEIKSIRNGKASIIEAYCIHSREEVWIRNMHVTEYENGSFYNHKPRADRKLLLNKKEINRIERFLKTKGNTLIPLRLFISDKGWAKIEIACAQGKKLHDKRQDLKEKDDKREMDRAMKR